MAETALFASVRNAGRTQMATAWLNALAHPGKVHAVSAGTDPAGAVYQAVIAVMTEIGLDITSSQPRLLTPILEGSADLIITSYAILRIDDQGRALGRTFHDAHRQRGGSAFRSQRPVLSASRMICSSITRIMMRP